MQPCEFSGIPVLSGSEFCDRCACRAVASNNDSCLTITKDPIMSDKSAKGIDRRDLIMASIATVGAAAVAVKAGAANAQDATTPPANPASGTVYTGDVIEGKKVVSALDVNDLEPGRKHLLYFQGIKMPTGQRWYVSVTV